MSIGLLGKKIGMTRVYDQESGRMTPVTVVDVAGNEWVQVKSADKDGYNAVQAGFTDKKAKRVTKAEGGHFSKHGATPKQLVREFRVENASDLPEAGAEHPGATMFADGQWVDVIGTTRGKGFQGVVKRHGFSGQNMSHGSMMHRRPGAIAAGSTPGLVWKNQKMPGHDGVVRRTVQNLKVVSVRAEDGALLISGAIPGPKNGFVIVRPAKKKPAPAKG